jgi:hypothetical protein
MANTEPQLAHLIPDSFPHSVHNQWQGRVLRDTRVSLLRRYITLLAGAYLSMRDEFLDPTSNQ